MCTRLEFKLSARHSDDNGVESLMKFLLAFLEERKKGRIDHWPSDEESLGLGKIFPKPDWRKIPLDVIPLKGSLKVK